MTPEEYNRIFDCILKEREDIERQISQAILVRYRTQTMPVGLEKVVALATEYEKLTAKLAELRSGK